MICLYIDNVDVYFFVPSRRRHAICALVTGVQTCALPIFTFFDAYKEVPYLEIWFGDLGKALIDFAVPISILLAIPFMLLLGLAIERGLIRFFYKRSHAEQILVTFGLALVLQEIGKAFFGANHIPTPAPDAVARPEGRRVGKERVRTGRDRWVT